MSQAELRTTTALTDSAKNDRALRDIPKIYSLLRHFAFPVADELGREHAMIQIRFAVACMVPLIDLRAGPGVDEVTCCRQMRGLQEIMLVVRGRHDPVQKLFYIQKLLNDPTWCWDLISPDAA